MGIKYNRNVVINQQAHEIYMNFKFQSILYETTLCNNHINGIQLLLCYCDCTTTLICYLWTGRRDRRLIGSLS